MSAVISSFFSASGEPATGLTPTIRIWEVNTLSDILVVTDAPMQEIDGGFYKYVFSGYDSSKNYNIRSDGGPSLASFERYSVGASVEQLTSIREAVFDATAIDYTIAGSVGFKVNQISSDVAQLRLDVNDLTPFLELLLKYERNRTRIDKIAKTLTVFDDDGTTPLKVFNLIDSLGVQSVTEVYERSPI